MEQLLMSYPNKSRLVDATHIDLPQPSRSTKLSGSNRSVPESLGDLENALRTIIETMVLQRLDAIFEGIRHLEAANDARSTDLPLVYRLPAILKLLAISKSTLYDWLNPQSEFYIPSLPRPFKLADHAHSPSFWSGPELRAWVEARASASRARLH
jgi:prophage regulatory protein